MKKHLLSLTVLALLVTLIFAATSWVGAQCPQDPFDHGNCDSLNMICVDGTQTPGAGPYLVRFPFLVTSDLVDSSDSIAGFVIPITWSRTNPAAWCSVTSYWNTTAFVGANFARSIFRDIIAGNDTLHNRMLELYNEGNGAEWDSKILNISTKPDSVHFWFTTLATGTDDQRWWNGNRILLATATFRIQDTMHVCVDSMFWPPSGRLSFTTSDSRVYTPRHNLPHCFWIGPARIQVVSPNGLENWAVGSTHNITWLSESFTANVKIEYSTNSGSSWLPVVASTSNTGSYPWVIPATPSATCRVKVSNAGGGDPSDISDADFSILAPDFTMSATPDTQTVQAGQSTSYKVILTALNGFASACTLSVTGFPTGVSGSFVPNPVTPNPTDSSAFSVNTLGTTTPGVYDLTITATQKAKAPPIQHSKHVFLKVTVGPDFSISATPDTQTVQAGKSTSYTVTLTSLYGFASSCSLTVTGLPTDASAGFAPNPIVPTNSSTMSVNTQRTTPLGVYDLTITAKELSKGLIQHTKHVFLKVTTPPDFAMAVKPDTLVVSQGTQGSFEVVLNSLFNFDSPCTLTVTGIPSDVSGAFDPAVIVPTDTSALTITVADTVPLGTYPLTITATEMGLVKTGGPITHSKQVFLLVREPGNFSLSVLPDTLKIIARHDSSYQVTLTALNGFASRCTLTVSGLPGSAYGGTFSPPGLVPSGTSTLHITVPDTAEADTFTLTITAAEEGAKTLYHTKDVKLILGLRRFGMEIEAVIPDTLRIHAGSSSSYAVIVKYYDDFSLPCTLSVSGLPACATGSFSPNPAGPPTDTSILTINTDPSCPLGMYDLTIHGKCLMFVDRFVDSAKVVLSIEEPSAVNDGNDQPNAPDKFALLPNQPNPFNPETKISYYLPRPSQVRLTIYNLLGQTVTTLFHGYQETGLHTLTWGGKDDNGTQVSSGIYFYRLVAGDFTQTRKMSLLK
ncbi:MAG: FlgD immunoglobulin-like domain containing protein [Candidatus Zixiibacteriota bacterium]